MAMWCYNAIEWVSINQLGFVCSDADSVSTCDVMHLKLGLLLLQ